MPWEVGELRPEIGEIGPEIGEIAHRPESGGARGARGGNQPPGAMSARAWGSRSPRSPQSPGASPVISGVVQWLEVQSH